jgi:hypothetical protein
VECSNRSQKSQASPPGPATETIGNALAEETPRRGTGSDVAVLPVVATTWLTGNDVPDYASQHFHRVARRGSVMLDCTTLPT